MKSASLNKTKCLSASILFKGNPLFSHFSPITFISSLHPEPSQSSSASIFEACGVADKKNFKLLFHFNYGISLSIYLSVLALNVL